MRWTLVDPGTGEAEPRGAISQEPNFVRLTPVNKTLYNQWLERSAPSAIVWSLGSLSP
jgi:hypothetical protein